MNPWWVFAIGVVVGVVGTFGGLGVCLLWAALGEPDINGDPERDAGKEQ